MTMASTDEYDKLSPEEREAKNKADRAREAAEQAGRRHNPPWSFHIDWRSTRRTPIHLASSPGRGRSCSSSP